MGARVNLVLALLLLASCLALVRVSYEARRTFSDLDRARAEQRQLDAEFKRLDAERQAQGTPRLVEKVAREQLQMASATPAVSTYVTDTVAAPAAGAASAAAGAR